MSIKSSAQEAPLSLGSAETRSSAAYTKLLDGLLGAVAGNVLIKAYELTTVSDVNTVYELGIIAASGYLNVKTSSKNKASTDQA